MRSNLLTIDCGNSTIDCLRHVDGVRLRLSVNGLEKASLAAFLAASVPARILGVSVSARALGVLESALAPTGGRLELAGRELCCPLAIDYEDPGSLGADRWVGALAAYRRRGASVVVDCGSATTVNWIDASGIFRGGAIAPGLRAFVAGLAAVTPGLPSPNLDAVGHLPARSSQAAVDAGVLIGYCGMVERLVAEALRKAGGSTGVLLTGGNAPRLLLHTRLRVMHVPSLVHDGLVVLAQGSSCGC